MPLVLYEEEREFLGLPSGTDVVLISSLLDEATLLFEKSCGRDKAPFASPITGRIEIHEPYAWSTRLWLDYPILTITSIVLGRDVANPDETLNPADPTKVVWRVGEQELVRTDGGVWKRYWPSWTKVVYNTQDDRPGDVKLAIKRMVAAAYQLRGKEGFSSITRGERSWTMAEMATESPDPFWQAAVNNHSSWIR